MRSSNINHFTTIKSLAPEITETYDSLKSTSEDCAVSAGRNQGRQEAAILVLRWSLKDRGPPSWLLPCGASLGGISAVPRGLRLPSGLSISCRPQLSSTPQATRDPQGSWETENSSY